MKLARAFVICGLLCLSNPVTATEFSAAISPPRFELDAEAGDVVREVITIKNAGTTPAEMQVRTADWSLEQDGAVIIYPEVLQPDSCRPWTLIERHRLSVAAQSERRYRFEVHVPEDAGRGECRFAILFQQSPDDADRMSMGELNLPVLGRVAVIVYVAVGGAEPQLDVKGVSRVNDSKLPVLVVENSGDAHGRAQGILTLKGAAGRSLQVVVSPSPILPGETRRIWLWPGNETEQAAPRLAYPISVSGTVEWANGEQEINAVVEASSASR